MPTRLSSLLSLRTSVSLPSPDGILFCSVRIFSLLLEIGRIGFGFGCQMDIFLFVAFHFVGGLVNSAHAQSCEQSYYETCLKQLVKFTDRGDLIFAESSEQLQQDCVQALSAVGCLKRYSKNCLSREERSKFNEGVDGPQKVAAGICSDETDLKTRYVQSLPCLRNMSRGLEFCKEKYDRNQKDIVLVEYEDKTHLYCCSFDGYRRCLRMLLETQSDCRENGTAQVIDEIAMRMGGTFSDDTCAEHFERCTGTVSSAHRNTFTALLLPALAVLSFPLRRSTCAQSFFDI